MRTLFLLRLCHLSLDLAITWKIIKGIVYGINRGIKMKISGKK